MWSGPSGPAAEACVPIEASHGVGMARVPDGGWCRRVGRRGAVVERTCHDLLQPFSLFGNWPVHASSHFLLQFQELRLHTVSPCFPDNQEAALAGHTTD